MINFYIHSKIFFLKCKALSDATAASATKKEYGFVVHLLERFRRSPKSISDERLNATCWSFRLFEIFVII